MEGDQKLTEGEQTMMPHHATTAATSRRQFLSRTLAAILGLAASHDLSPASGAADPKQRRVLVIGAGVAGLATAAELKSLGFEVLVIESRDRIGGRVWTANLGGQPVDLGAQWIEGIDKNPICQLCQKHQIETVKSNYDSDAVCDIDGRRYDDATEERLEKQGKHLVRKTRPLNRERLDKKEADITMAEALQKVGLEGDAKTRENRFLRWTLAWEVESAEADDLKNLSLRNYWADPDEGKGDKHIFPSGYGQIPQLLAKGLDIRLGQKVKTIPYDSSGVTLEAAALLATDRLAHDPSLTTAPA
jgi:monoamine oxidase